MLIDFYIGDMRLKNRTSDSIRTNQNSLQRFAEYAGGVDVKLIEVTPEVARAYIENLQARQSKWNNHPNRPPENKLLSPYTIRKAVKILRSFGAWMDRNGFGNPCSVLEIPSVPKQIVDTLAEEEIQKLLDAMNPQTANGARNHAMFLFMLDAGPRVSEVADLRMEHLDVQNRQARIMGKGRKERHVPFGQKTARAFLRYIAAFRAQPVNPENTQVFLSLDGYPMTRNSIECVIRRLRDASGVSKLHSEIPHSDG